MSTSGAAEFAAFYAGSRPRLLRALSVVTDSVADAEDALQEAYVRCADRWGSLDDPEPWVRRVAFNAARDSHRRRLVRLRAHARLAPPADVPGLEPTAVAVVAALRQLPKEQRQVLALHYLLDLPVEQVARDLDRPVGTVKAQLSRGRARLAAVLEPEGATRRDR